MNPGVTIIRRVSTILVAALALVAALGARDAQAPAEIRVVSYNIRHGRGTDEKVDLARTAGVLRSLQPDIVGLQEVDDKAKRSGGVAEAEQLGQSLGLHHAFGKFMDYQGGAYGMAILTRWSIEKVEPLQLPEGNEPRIALIVHTRLPGGQSLAVVSVHFDWVRDDGFRFAQAQTLARHLAGMTTPYILLGDFNDLPESRTLALFKAGRGEATKPSGASFTFPSSEPAREIDYVFFSPASMFRPREVRVIDERVASDHRPLLAVLSLGR